MRKGIWSAAAFVLLSGAAAFALGIPGVRAADNRVAMGSNDEPLKFLPAEISVPVGTKVEWFNDTSLQHDVSAEDGSFDSKGLLDKGQKYEFTFSKAGEFKYFCTPHKDAGMKGVVKVTGAGATPTTAATTPTTQPGTATTATTAAAGASTTTTAKGASTTTTAAPADGATTTTLAPTATPTSGPDGTAETTTTTAAGHGGGEEAAGGDLASEGQDKKEKKKNSPIGIAFASVSTVLLAAIAGKLLASKS